MAGNTRSTGAGKDGFDAGVSEQSIRKALDYARRLKAQSAGDLLDYDSETPAVEEPVTLDKALSELPRLLQPRRTGMYRVPSVPPPPKPEE